MESQEYKLVKVYRFHVPDTLGWEWEIEYTALFRVNEQGITVCDWSCNNGDTGTMTLKDKGITWGALLEMWHALAAITAQLARKWNEQESNFTSKRRRSGPK